MRIKNKIIKWLGIDKIKSDIDNIDKRVVSLEHLLQVSLDYSPHHRDISWAVISVKGKSEYVQFFNLGRADIREISAFLKRYEPNNTTIDSISGMPSNLFYGR